ncbi:MAG: hypothetical protein LC637_05140 [Xanthomonadaceae bacterium]|nr:hypothetical protein [Xanthomonadaceae bacterium]
MRQRDARRPIWLMPGEELRHSEQAYAHSTISQIQSSDASPDSLYGTTPDGQLRFDSRGVVIDRELRHRFDYWLTRIGETPLSVIRDQLEASLASEFGTARATAVVAEFDLYIEYLMAVESLLPAPSASQRQRHAAQVELQQTLLGSTRAEVWFGEENRYIEHILSMHQDEPVPRTAPRPFGYDPRTAVEHHFAMELESQSLQLDIDAGQRREERRELFGDEAAQRLGRLDLQRSRWNQRVGDFSHQRQRLLNDNSLTPAEVLRAINALVEQNFEPAEQRRIKALTEAGLLPGEPNSSPGK